MPKLGPDRAGPQKMQQNCISASVARDRRPQSAGPAGNRHVAHRSVSLDFRSANLVHNEEISDASAADIPLMVKD
jgi:hypothetical protein